MSVQPGLGKDLSEAGAEDPGLAARLITVGAAGRIIGVDRRTVYNFIQDGRLKGYRFGGEGYWRLDRAEVELFQKTYKRWEGWRRAGTCTREDCRRIHWALGLCRRHYYARRKELYGHR